MVTGNGGTRTGKPSLPRAGKVRTGPYKVDVGKRIGAGALDLVVACIPGIAVVFTGGLLAAALFVIAYLLVRDGLPIAALDYASIGKKILGLHVESEASGEARIDPVASIKRNATLVPGLILLPLLWGTSSILAVAVASIPAVVELVMTITDANGLRMGDRIAGTKVLD